MKFNNVDLQSKYEISQQILSERKKQLDACSEDIKLLEKMLQPTAKFFKKNYGDFSLCFDSFQDKINYEDNIYNKPLIETKIDIRLKCWPFLGDFLQSFMEELKNENS